MVTRTCRVCDTSLEGVIERDQSLSALGYKHRDDTAECPNCGAEHTFGVPEDPPTSRPPTCPVCGGRQYPYKLGFYDVVEEGASLSPVRQSGTDSLYEQALSDLRVHWKCEDCYYFRNETPTGGWKNVVLLGVEHLRGELDA